MISAEDIPNLIVQNKTYLLTFLTIVVEEMLDDHRKNLLFMGNYRAAKLCKLKRVSLKGVN